VVLENAILADFDIFLLNKSVYAPSVY